jgi:hypothetical protein
MLSELIEDPDPLVLRHEKGEGAVLAQAAAFLARIIEHFQNPVEAAAQDREPFADAILEGFAVSGVGEPRFHLLTDSAQAGRIGTEDPRDDAVHLEIAFVGFRVGVHGKTS